MASLERLYELYNIIAEAKDASQHENEFTEILGGVKGEMGARRMTAQFISRYFTTFPNQEDEALNALFDLCEDDDLTIRKQSITSLGVVCRGKPELVPKVADILAQLLQIEDPAEVNCVHSALVALLRVHAKGTLTGLFYQLNNNEDEVIRARVLQFLQTKVKQLTPDVFTKEVQIFVFTEAKKFIPNASDTELTIIMTILGDMAVCRTVTAQIQLAELLLAQLDLTKPLTDAETIMKASTVLSQVKSYYSKTIRPTEAMKYLLTQAIPYMDSIEAQMLVSGKPEDAAVPVTLLQMVAQFLAFVETIEEPKAAMEHLFKALMSVLPVPPTDPTAEFVIDGAELQFSRAECLLYTLQQLTKQCNDFFGDAESLKDFRHRLTYFSRWAQAYQKTLREAIQGKKGDELKTEECKAKLISLKATANINSMIKDFFHNPPSAKSTVTLSWLVEAEKAEAKKSLKRPAAITFDDSNKGAKKAKTSQKKKQNSGGNFRNGSSFRGRGRGRGSFRRY